ncbi:MAG: YihY/virulence factor BrkB family protein [Pseudomonadota bacterium]
MIKRIRWMIGVVKEALRRFADDDHAVYAGHMAFTMLLSFGPFVVCAILLASYVDPLAEQHLQEMIASLKESALIPAPMAQLFADVVAGVAPNARAVTENQEQWWLVWVTAAVGLYAGSSAFEAARNGFNEAYDVKDRRSVVFRRLQSHVLALCIASLFVLVSSAFVAASIVFSSVQEAQLAAAEMGIEPEMSGLLLIGALILFVAFMFWALLLGIHITLPRGYVKNRSLYVWAADEIEDIRAVRVPLMPGVRVSAILWLSFAIGYSFVIGTVVNFGTNHGALAGVVATLLFFYISSAMIFFGAQINIAIATVDDYGRPAWPHPSIKRPEDFDESQIEAFQVLTHPKPESLFMRLWHDIWGGHARVKNAPEDIEAAFRAQDQLRKERRRAARRRGRVEAVAGAPAE